MYHEISNIVCFLTFSVKLKENDLHRKYTFFWGPAENVSSPTISQIEQSLWYHFVYQDYAQSAKMHVFLNVYRIKCRKIFDSFLQINIFMQLFVCFVLFFTRNRWKQMETDGNRWKQMETDGNRWKQMETDGNRWK